MGDGIPKVFLRQRRKFDFVGSVDVLTVPIVVYPSCSL